MRTLPARVLLLLLAPIALVDSTSIVPIAIVPMIAMMAGTRPFGTTTALICGIFATYLACGVALALGLAAIFDELLEPIADAYRPEIAEQAWGRLVAFLSQHLTG